MKPDEKQAMLLQGHLNLVIEKNRTVNLTRIDTFEEGELLHIEDSLAGLQEFSAAPLGNAADLGTGGGYPGIPLAIMSGRPIDLVESVGKKARALQDIVDALEISDGVQVYNGRSEELAIARPNAYSVVVARALAALPSLIELASPLLEQDGILVAYKSQQYQEELQHALNIQEKLGMEYIGARSFTLSDGKTRRSILTFKKVSDPRVKLPRRPGMAQKNPYKK